MIPKHFELKPVEPIDETGRIMTATVMCCGLCDRVISGMGGPGNGIVCEPCGELLKSGALRNVVTWEN